MLFTKTDPLWYFKFQYSKNDTGKNFKHTVIDKLPSLRYRFGEGNNWSATSFIVTSQIDKIQGWFDSYWELRSDPISKVNRTLYEEELENAILKAYSEVNDKWTEKLEAEFEARFDDKLLGFFSGEKQNI